MKEKIEAARRARELASPRPHTKKRTGSFAGGRSTPRGAAAGGGGGGAAGSWVGGAVGGSGSSGSGGGGGGGSNARKGAARSKARASSEGAGYVGGWG